MFFIKIQLTWIKISLPIILKLKNRAMSTFKQVLNPMTGESGWEPISEDYDYHQEIARSAFADMLHDHERNDKYYRALKIAVDTVHARGDKVHVLDIGTGTGILSMMAVRCGADIVTACEAFKPMAECAERIIAENGMGTQIKIIRKRSTDMIVGRDMEQRANVLVTELFDTELIGEGAIGSFNHAHEQLLEPGCIVVPDSATIYGQIVESPLAWSWNEPKLLANLDGEILLRTPKKIVDCEGSAAVHDIQLNQFRSENFSTITEPIAVVDFDWSGKSPIKKRNNSAIQMVANRSGVMHVIFMWWDLRMDQAGEIILSCAPHWAHPDMKRLREQNNDTEKPVGNIIPWRDHWMQAIYYLRHQVPIIENQEFTFHFHHDEYSLWFDVSTGNSQIERFNEPPTCKCGFHVAYSRTRIGQLNDNIRNKKYLNFLEQTINKQSIVLSLSDGSLLGLSTAALNSKCTYCFEPNRYSRQVMQEYVNSNNLMNVKIIERLDDIDDIQEITHIFGEPSFLMSILPWDNFYFGTLCARLKEKLSTNVIIAPSEATIYAVPVEFLDLHKIRSPLGVCEGFDLNLFDLLIETSSDVADMNVEAQPLWEYPCKALGSPIEILNVNVNTPPVRLIESKDINIELPGTCNGIALYVHWYLSGRDGSSSKSIISTGPTVDIVCGKYIEWDKHTRQGVHLITENNTVKEGSVVHSNIEFCSKDGILSFKFLLN